MKTEYQVTPELSLLVREDGMVEYSLHNRIYPQAYASSILTLQELEDTIKRQIDVLKIYATDTSEVEKRIADYTKRPFILGNAKFGAVAGVKNDK